MTFRPSAPAAALTILALTASPFTRNAGAQNPAPTQSPVSPVQSQSRSRVDTLVGPLEEAPWDVARQGTLLTVDPQNTRPESSASPAAAGATDGRRASLRDVAARFGRKIVRVGGITVLAPTTMAVLNTRPGKPDVLAGLSRSDRLQALLATLTSAQWRLLGSPRGLGASDLSGPDQRDLFLAVLPSPLQIYEVEASGAWNPARPIVLPAAERARTRLRLVRTATFRFTGLDNPRASLSLRSDEAVLEHTPRYTTGGIQEENIGADRFGVTLRRAVPNRLKPGDLAFDAPNLARPVSLEGAATVGDLVERAGQSAGLTLYADRRVAGLPVWARFGASAPAGEVLRALCLAVTSTFRKISAESGGKTVYVLTDDRTGLGARAALLGEWLDDAEERRQELAAGWERRIARAEPLPYLTFAEDDPLALGSALTRRIEADMARLPWKGYRPTEMVLSDLPPEQQNVLRSWVGAASEQHGRIYQINRFGVGMDLYLAYVIPAVGTVPDRSFFVTTTPWALLHPDGGSKEPSDNDGPVALPAAGLAARALYLNAATSDEVRAAAREARRRGLNQLWLEVAAQGNDDEAVRFLTEAIKAAGENGLPVWAVVRLLRPAPLDQNVPDDRNEVRDVNVLGETAAQYAVRRPRFAAQHDVAEDRSVPADPRDWLRIDLPAVADALRRRLVRIASAPGLAGLALRDTAAPGYADPATNFRSTAFNDPRDFGYTPGQRLAFLRREGYDPLDLVNSGHDLGPGVLDLPFYSGHNPQPRLIPVNGRMEMDPAVPGPPLLRWRAFRNQANVAFLSALHAALRGSGAPRPDLPLLVRDRSAAYFGDVGGWYGSWDAAERLPGRVFGGTDPAALARIARTQSRRNLLNVVADTAEDPRAFSQAVAATLGNAKAEDWDGFVLDVSGVPADKALPLLTRLASAASEAGK